MAAPITWRNIGSNVSSVSPAALTAGTAGVRQFLDSLSSTIAGQQDMQVANAKVEREANTQGFLDQVGSASLEQLSDPEFVAGLEAQRDAQGLNLDRAATRNAITKQIGSLQDAAIKQQQTSDVFQEVAERETIDQLRGAAASGDTATVDKVLGERQLLNEGAIRKELNAVYDNQQARDYREAGEARAQASAERAAESHAISMTTAKENLDFSREVRGEAREKRNQTKLAGSIVDQIMDDYDGSRASTNELLRNVAKEQGIPTGQDGLPDLSAITPEQKESYESAVKESGAQANLSATDERRAILDKLQSEGVAPDVQKQALEMFETNRTLREMAPEDREKTEAAVSAANAGIDQAIQNKTRDYEREVGRNPFVEPSKTPVSDVNNMMKELKTLDFGTESDRQEMNNMLIEFATNGLTTQNAAGEQVKIPVPTSVLQNAIATLPSTWTLVDEGKEDLEKRITEMLATDGMRAMANAAPGLRESFLKDVQDLNTQKLGNAAKITRSAQQRSGVTINPNDIVSNVLNRR